jgi:Fic family protein
MTIDRLQFIDAVNKTHVLPSAYAEDILVRLAHNSSAIEGNTLSLSDTITLLVDQLTPTAGVSMREIYEVANHREALIRVLQAVSDEQPLTVNLVRDLHSRLMDHLAYDRGNLKTSANVVLGAAWEPAPPSRVLNLMREWADQVEWQTANLDGQPLLEAIAASHIRFERIHPFSDGNGRTGRAIVAYQTIRRFGFPAIVSAADRSEYIRLLDTVDAPGRIGFVLWASAWRGEYAAARIRASPRISRCRPLFAV